MKARLLSVLGVALAAALAVFSAPAAEVTPEQALTAAQRWLTRNRMPDVFAGETVASVTKETFEGVSFYVAKGEGGGILVLSADTTRRPVLFIAPGTEFPVVAENPAVSILVADLRAEPDAATAAANEREWRPLISVRPPLMATPAAQSDIRVDELVKTRWNQNKAGSEFCYDYYTPTLYTDATRTAQTGNHSPAGCVPVATAQVIKYFNYPEHYPEYSGSMWVQDYDGPDHKTNLTMRAIGEKILWDDMPDAPTSATPRSQRQAIGTFVLNVGIAVFAESCKSWANHFGYGFSGSGAETSKGAPATLKIFQFTNSLWCPTDDRKTFDRFVIANLNAKRPLITTISGHAIVCDGYRYIGDALYYHMNYGWGGSSNGWYLQPTDVWIGGVVGNIYTRESKDLVILSGRVTAPTVPFRDRTLARDGDTTTETTRWLDFSGVTVTVSGAATQTAQADEKGIWSALVKPGNWSAAAAGDVRVMRRTVVKVGGAVESDVTETEMTYPACASGAVGAVVGTGAAGVVPDCDLVMSGGTTPVYALPAGYVEIAYAVVDGKKVYATEEIVPCRNGAGTAGLFSRATGAFTAASFTGAYELPDDCTAVEYIESDGGAYVDTGYTHRSNTTVACEVDVAAGQSPSSCAVFGARADNGRTSNKLHALYFLSKVSGTDGRPAYCRSGSETNGVPRSFPCDTRISLVCEGGTASWTWDEGRSSGSIENAGAVDGGLNPLFIFTLDDDTAPGGQMNRMRLYSFTVTEDGVAKRDFVPCRNADRVAGLWDRVTGRFYPSASAEPFLAPWPYGGLPAGYKAVDFIESDGRQYVDSGVSARPDTKAEMQVTVTGAGNTGFFGAVENGLWFSAYRNGSGNFASSLSNDGEWSGGSPATPVKNDTRYTVTLDAGANGGQGAYTVNGQPLTCCTNAVTGTASTTIVIGGRRRSYEVEMLPCRIYSFKLWRGETPIRDLVPCRNADAVPGLFDFTSGKFYASATSEPFYAPWTGGGVPPGYSAIEYIESDGSQYVDTGVKARPNTKVEADMQVTTIIGGRGIFGSDDGSSMRFALYGSGSATGSAGLSYCLGNKRWEGSGWNFDTSRHVYTLNAGNGGLLLLDKDLLKYQINQGASGLSQYNIDICARNYDGNHNIMPCRVFGFKISEGGTAVRDFVPCRRDSDNAAGLFDRVTGRFVTSATATPFGGPYGDARLPKGYVPVEYIESDGNQYIDTGVRPDSKTRVVMEFAGARDLGKSEVFFSAGAWSKNAYHFCVLNNNSGASRRFMFGNSDEIEFKDAGLYGIAGWNGSKIRDYRFVVGDGCLTLTDRDTKELLHESKGLTISVSAVNHDLTLFKAPSGTAYPSAYKLYSFKIATGGGVLQRDFVPCRNLNGEAGLWDRVEGKFYCNRGSGSFKAPLVRSGAEGLPEGYTRLDWIQSDGSQYVDTGYQPTVGTQVTAFFRPFEQSEGWSAFFGVMRGDSSARGLTLRYFDSGTNTLNAVFCNANPREVQTEEQLLDTDVAAALRRDMLFVNEKRHPITTTGTPCDGSLILFGERNGTEIRRTQAMRLYALVISEDGEVVHDYVPCRDPDGTCGLYDLVAAEFRASDGSRAFMGQGVVAYAKLYGSGYAYYAPNGERVDGPETGIAGLPLAFANDAEYRALVDREDEWRADGASGVILERSVALAQDNTDWSALSFDLRGHTLDLAGRRLAVRDLRGKSSTVTSSAEGGVLEIRVDAGLVVTNSEVALTGGANLQLWKTGEGTLAMNRVNTGFGYVGGDQEETLVSTIVKAGTMIKTANGGTCGGQYSTIVVEKGARFDVRGRSYWDYSYEIAGDGPDGAGALVNTAEVELPYATNGSGYLLNVALAGDATIGGSATWSLAFYNHYANTLDLNGYTLTFKCADEEMLLYGGNLSYSGDGRIVIAEGCRLETYNSSPAAGDAVLEVRGVLHQHSRAITPVKSLIFTETGRFCHLWRYPEALPGIVVRETYAPNLGITGEADDDPNPYHPHPRVTLGTATDLETTLDLSLFDGPFDASSLSFQPSSIVTVDIGERSIAIGDKLVSWPTAPAGVTFVLPGDYYGVYTLVLRSDGLYVSDCMPAYARPGARPGEWLFFDEYGRLFPDWKGGVTGDIEVRFSSFEEYDAIRAAGVSPSRFVLSGTIALTEDTVFAKGVRFVGTPDSAIDLRGHRLTVEGSMLAEVSLLNITDTTSGYEMLAYVESDGRQHVDTKVKAIPGTRVEADIQVTTIKGATGIFGSIGGSMNFAIYGAGNATGSAGLSYCLGDLTWEESGASFDTSRHVYTLDSGNGGVLKIDNTVLKRGFDPGGQGTSQYTIPIGARNNNGGIDRMPCRIYAFRLWEDGTQVLDLVPARRLSDGAVGLLNRTDGGFYPSADLATPLLAGPVVADGARGGELHVTVPEGKTFVNAQNTFSGSLKLVKEGGGTFVSAAASTYYGGTEIAEGTLQADEATCFGAPWTEVTVNPGTVLEMGGRFDLVGNWIVLAGGTLRNTVADADGDKVQLKCMRLTADSTMELERSYGFINNSHTPVFLDLGGHTLTVNVGEDKTFWFHNASVSAGTLRVTGERGVFAINRTSLRGAEASFDLACSNVAATVGCDVGDWTVREGTEVTGDGTVTIRGAYRPIGDSISQYRLADGATLDLAGRDRPFDIRDRNIHFADGATIYVNLPRRAHVRELWVPWIEPDNLPTLKFRRAPGSKAGVHAEAEGLVVDVGFAILVR